jgi:hypothetical protein
MGEVVDWRGMRRPPGKDNADLVEHLREAADSLEAGDYGKVQLVSVVILDGSGKVRHFNRTTRHILSTEYLGILQVAQHQVLNDIHPEDWDEHEEPDAS